MTNTPEDDEHTKDVMKEAIKEWLDEKFMMFGRWTFNALAAVLLAALVYFMLTFNGWKHIP